MRRVQQGSSLSVRVMTLQVLEFLASSDQINILNDVGADCGKWVEVRQLVPFFRPFLFEPPVVPSYLQLNPLFPVFRLPPLRLDPGLGDPVGHFSRV